MVMQQRDLKEDRNYLIRYPIFFYLHKIDQNIK